jgi:bile acid:Na+ symporter, BASS family
MSPEKLIAAAVLVSLTFSAGLEVNREHLFAILKDVGLLGRALLANFVIVPILGVLFVKLFALPPEIATGLLLMAIAPGVPLVLISVRKRGGSLGLAVELALFLPLLSVVTVPLTAQLVLPPGALAHLPLGQFVVTLLLFQTLPLLLGIAVGQRIPALAPRLSRIFRVIFLLTLLVLLVALVPKVAHSVASVYGSRGMLAMLCVVVLSMLTGLALGGPARETRRVLGTATTLRNIGLAALIASSGFPDSSLVPAAVLSYLLVQVIVSSVAGIYFTRTVERAPA